ncbi:MAG: VTT domain-containing protein [Gemmatimonadota bacterium]
METKGDSRGRRGARWVIVSAVVLGLILIPFGLVGASLDAWSLSVLDALDSRALIAAFVVGILALDVLLPVPSSIVSTLAGAALGWPLGTAASAIGMSLGCGLGYVLGARGGRPSIVRWVGEVETARFDTLMDRHGSWTLVLCRAVPVMAEASVLLAGAARLGWSTFLWATVLPNVGIALVYSVIGSNALGGPHFLMAFLVAIGLPGVAWLALRFVRGEDPRRLADAGSGRDI